MKLKIASELQQGVTIHSMLDWIQDREGDKLGHQHLMCSQEVYATFAGDLILVQLKSINVIQPAY